MKSWKREVKGMPRDAGRPSGQPGLPSRACGVQAQSRQASRTPSEFQSLRPIEETGARHRAFLSPAELTLDFFTAMMGSRH